MPMYTNSDVVIAKWRKCYYPQTGQIPNAVDTRSCDEFILALIHSYIFEINPLIWQRMWLTSMDTANMDPLLSVN